MQKCQQASGGYELIFGTKHWNIAYKTIRLLARIVAKTHAKSIFNYGVDPNETVPTGAVGDVSWSWSSGSSLFVNTWKCVAMK